MQSGWAILIYGFFFFLKKIILKKAQICRVAVYWLSRLNITQSLSCNELRKLLFLDGVHFIWQSCSEMSFHVSSYALSVCTHVTLQSFKWFNTSSFSLKEQLIVKWDLCVQQTKSQTTLECFTHHRETKEERNMSRGTISKSPLPQVNQPQWRWAENMAIKKSSAWKQIQIWFLSLRLCSSNVTWSESWSEHGNSRHREAVKETRHIQNELNTNLCRDTLLIACSSHWRWRTSYERTKTNMFGDGDMLQCAHHRWSLRSQCDTSINKK